MGVIIYSPPPITLIFGGWGGKEGGVNRSFVPFLSFIPLHFLSLLLSISAPLAPFFFFSSPLEFSFDGRRSEGASLFLFVPCRVGRSIQSNHFLSLRAYRRYSRPVLKTNLARSSRRLWGNISPHQEPRSCALGGTTTTQQTGSRVPIPWPNPIGIFQIYVVYPHGHRRTLGPPPLPLFRS